MDEVGVVKSINSPLSTVSKPSTLNSQPSEGKPSAVSGKLKPGDIVVRVSEDFYRPTDVVNLWGDPTKAKAKLGWNPAKTSFEKLVQIMVEADIAKVASEGAAAKVRTNLAEYLEKGIVK